MVPLGSPTDWLARRYGPRTLARVVVALSVLLVATQALVLWYAGSVGVSLGEMAPASDDRTVVVDGEDLRTFERHYSEQREVGWCLYGRIGNHRIRIHEVVHANALVQKSDRIQFTCVRETAGQVVNGRNARLVGVAHSHPSMHRSYLSRSDAMTWGRTSPVVEVMAVYTRHDGIEFFTVRSLNEPLDKEIR